MTDKTNRFNPSPDAVALAKKWVAEWESLTDAERQVRDEALAKAIREVSRKEDQ